MTAQQDESGRWFIQATLPGGESTTWFSSEDEAHGYEAQYDCDGSCKWGQECRYLDGGCC